MENDVRFQNQIATNHKYDDKLTGGSKIYE